MALNRVLCKVDTPLVKPIAAAIALLLGAATLALSSCGSSGASTVGSSAAASTSVPETSPTSTTPEANGFSGEGCTSGPADADVRVTIYGEETCALWDRTQSSSGTFWHEAQFPRSNEEKLVCSMEGPGAHTLIEVRDTGAHFYGNRICASLTAENWHDAEGPGAKVEQSRKAQEAEEKAKAEEQAQSEHESEERRRAAEQKREEARHKLENEQSEAEYKKNEAESKKQQEQSERENRAQERKNEEETKRNEREAETH